MKPVTVNARTFAPLPTMTNIEGLKVGLMYEVACVTPSASSPFFPAMTYILVTQIWIVLEAALIAAKASSSLLPIFALQGSPAFVLVLAIESMLCSSALRRILSGCALCSIASTRLCAVIIVCSEAAHYGACCVKSSSVLCSSAVRCGGLHGLPMRLVSQGAYLCYVRLLLRSLSHLMIGSCIIRISRTPGIQTGAFRDSRSARNDCQGMCLEPRWAIW
jgi:hypothetical protein